MPKVSIIMPVYNGAKYIGEAIASIAAQTYKHWELIVVDDGSTDNTENVIARSNVPLKFLRQQNRGPSAARNLGLQSAMGNYVVFLDADDTLDSKYLELTVQELDRHDEKVIGVCCGWFYTDQYGVELAHTRISRAGFLGIYDFLSANPFPIHAFLVRKNSLLSVDGFDAEIMAMEDWDLWLRQTAMGGQFFAIPACLARYRLHGITNSHHPDRMRTGRLRALEKLFARHDLPDDVRVLQPHILGRALVQSSIELYDVGRESEALSVFCEAVRHWPRLMEESEVLYAVVCARQPVGYKGTNEFLDLASGEIRLFSALQAGMQAIGNSDQKRLRRVLSKAYLTLARLAYGQRQTTTTWRYIFLALKNDIHCIHRTNAIWLLAKSLMRPRWLNALKGLRV